MGRLTTIFLETISTVLSDARAKGIKVVSWDADSRKDARDFFVNQCTAASVAHALLDVMAEGAGPEAKYIIVTGSLTAGLLSMLPLLPIALVLLWLAARRLPHEPAAARRARAEAAGEPPQPGTEP